MNATGIVNVDVDIKKAQTEGNGNYTVSFKVKEFYNVTDIV